MPKLRFFHYVTESKTKNECPCLFAPEKSDSFPKKMMMPSRIQARGYGKNSPVIVGVRRLYRRGIRLGGLCPLQLSFRLGDYQVVEWYNQRA